MYHENLNVRLIVENVSQIKNEIAINVRVSSILLHVVTKELNMFEVLLIIQWLGMMKLKEKHKLFQ